MSGKILITGSEGLVGSALRRKLESSGFEVRGLDIRADDSEAGDVRDTVNVRNAMRGCIGIIHLAAVSRVVWGERDPDLCWKTNVEGFRNVLEAADQLAIKPWVIFASSREVYGQPERLPADEETPLRPVNVYARSKVAGEQLIAEARDRGLRACVIRLSNVYGSTQDHPDRVVPAFARAALLGQPLRIDGCDHTFDFTHISDVVQGIAALVELLDRGVAPLPPIHFVSGVPTTLGQLAKLAIDVAQSDSTVTHAPPRNFDVAKFHGCPGRAQSLLGWSPCTSLRQGLTALINDFSAVHKRHAAKEAS
jgi:nucleoside-diphosphate-sugar epimerase